MKTLKSIIAMVLLVCMMSTMVYATEVKPVPTFTDTSSFVKKGAIDIGVVTEQIKQTIISQDKEGSILEVYWDGSPTKFDTDGAMSATIKFKPEYAAEDKKVTATYTVVKPTFVTSVILPEISSSDSNNSSQRNLLSYVNRDLSLTVSDDDTYKSALGTSPNYSLSPFEWGNNTYVSTGDRTYTFTQVYEGAAFTRTVKVTGSSTSAPNVYIDYGSSRVNTTRDMQYSFDNRSWSGCSDNMSIPSTWYGRTLYFKRPGSQYVYESAISNLYIPTKADTPTTKPDVVATSYGLIINNVSAYDDPQFSLGKGDDWQSTKKSTFVFENLAPNTRYTVMVREAPTGRYLYSEPLSVTISTLAGKNKGMTVSKVKKNNVTYISANGYTPPTYSSESLNDSYTSAEMMRISDEVKNTSGTVITNIIMKHKLDAGDTRAVKKVKVSFPGSSIQTALKTSNTSLFYDNALLGIRIGNADLKTFASSTWSFQVETVSKVTGTKLDWVAEQIKANSLVYKVTLPKDVAATYYLPYSFSGKQAIDSVTIYHVDDAGVKTQMKPTYKNGSFVFDSAKSGYFVIIEDVKKYITTDFTDINDHWAYTYIVYCTSKDLFNGVSETEFAPTMEISRSMLVTLLARMSGEEVSSYVANHFTDVSKDDWYGKSVTWALENKIITKQTDEFKPNEGLTREEVAAILYNYLVHTKQVRTCYTTTSYDDSRSFNVWAIDPIDYLAELGVMSGVENNKFNPTAKITRAEMATILYRLGLN